MNKRCVLIIILVTQMWGWALLQPGWADSRKAAQDYMRAGQWDYASYEWRNVLDQTPRDIDAHLGLARSLIRAGFAERATAHLEQHRAGLKDVRVDLLLADTYRQTRQTDKALACYQALLRQYPYHPAALGGLKAMMGMVSEPQRAAIQNLVRQTVQQMRQQAVKAYGEKRYADAARYYEVVAKDTRAFKDINDYGLSLLLAGKPAEALKQFRLLENRTQDWHILSNAALAELAVGQSARARHLVNKALSLCASGTDRALLYNLLGYIYETAGKNLEARFAYQKAVELNADYRKAYLNQAYIYRKDRAYDEALNVYKSLLERDPQNAELWNQLGLACEMKREYGKAIHAYERAIALDSRHREAHYNLGMLYKKLGETKKAMNTFKRMMDQDFQAIEAAKPVHDQGRTAAAILKYVDVYTASPVQTPSLAHQ